MLQKKTSKNITKCILMLVVIIGIGMFFGVGKSYAKEVDSTIVRVGWYHSTLFQEGMADDSVKSGYCYDFLQNISDYNGWEYVYVYGDWSELYEMLRKGEIDILAGVSRTEEREKYILFPDYEMGEDQYYLFKHADDDSMSLTDLSTFVGKKVGGIHNNRMTVLAEEWLIKNGIDAQIVYYDDFDMLSSAFEKGEIDLISQTINNVQNVNNISAFVKVGEEPYYLAVSKQNPQLLASLNKSLGMLTELEPFFIQTLQHTYFGKSVFGTTLSSAELEWAKEHTTLVVGYMTNYLPFSGQDKEGNAIGIMTDVMSEILSSLGLSDTIQIIYAPYKNYDDMIEALKDNQLDMAFPVSGDMWALEQDNINGTATVVSSAELLVYKGNYEKTPQTLAVNKNNKMQIQYCKNEFPDAKLIYYSGMEECLDAVLTGKADGTLLNSMRTQLLTENVKYSKLSYVWLSVEDTRCFAVNEADVALLLLMNRGLKFLGSYYGVDASYKYISSVYSYGGVDFIREHFFLFAIIGSILILTIIVGLLVILRRKERSIRKIEALNKELSEARLKADSANEAKTMFLSNMSHDIRTPMNAILGYVGLLRTRENDPEIVDDYLGKIEKSGDYLLSIINNVLEMARIDSGKECVDETFTDFFDENCSVIPLLEEEIRKKNLKVTQEMHIQHRFVFADMIKIREITMNLMSNAIKYTPEGGHIHMRFEEVPCDKPGYGTYINTISDTGIGMSKEFLDHLFDVFSREKNTTESKVIGTGLGMPIVKKLVELQGGKIEVESEPGKGTTFRVIIDHRLIDSPDEYVKDQKRKNTQKFSFEGKRILLAEDNDLNAEIAAEILSGTKAEVDRAVDGVDCINKLMNAGDNYYDLILMDIQMPNLNGYETAEKIRQTGIDIPIYAMTANAFEEDRKNAIHAGMNGHISKPINVEVLMEKLSDVMCDDIITDEDIITDDDIGDAVMTDDVK